MSKVSLGKCNILPHINNTMSALGKLHQVNGCQEFPSHGDEFGMKLDFVRTMKQSSREVSGDGFMNPLSVLMIRGHSCMKLTPHFIALFHHAHYLWNLCRQLRLSALGQICKSGQGFCLIRSDD